MRRFAIPVILFGMLTAGCGSSRADIIMGPYVNYVSESSAKILWVTRPDVAAGSVVLVDKAHGKVRIEVEAQVAAISGRPELLHTAVVSGLKGASTHAYSVMCGGDRAKGSFQTPPPTGSRRPFKFIVYGDTRTNSQDHRTVINAMKTELPIAFIVNTGDLVANGTVWSQWKEEFFGPAEDILARTALWPVRGNHEMDAVLFRGLFDLPNNELYYSFDYGNLHVVALDHYQSAGSAYQDEDERAEMLAWLERDLAATKADWIVVAYHEPTFNIGGHGSTWGQEDVLPVLEKYGVDLVMNGHSHVYERFRPIGPKGKKPIIHIVTGGGGAPAYAIQPSPILESSYAGLHFCVFGIDGNKLKMTARTPDGRVLDQLTLVKSNGMYQDEVMKRALDTEEAIRLAFVESARLRADFIELPRPGVRTAANIIPRDQLPAGGIVRIGTAGSGRWSVDEARFRSGEAPFRIIVVPPEDLEVPPGQVVPPLSVAFSVTCQGETYSREDVQVGLTMSSVRKLTPEPKAVDIPRAAAAITVDGHLTDWKDIPPIVLPFTKSPSKTTRLAWRPEGLYGALCVRDESIQVMPGRAWLGDCLEWFLEADYTRSSDARRGGNAFKCQLYPLPDAGPGTAQVEMAYGLDEAGPDVIRAAWQKTRDGYNLEFLISAEGLAPAEMAVGTKMGLHFIVHDGGRTVEQFVDTTGKRSVWRTPLHWGAVRLVEGR